MKWGNKPINEEQVSILLVDNEHRGNDASGIVIQQKNGTLDILKKDSPAWLFVSSHSYKEFIEQKLKEDSRSVLLHARGASQGNPRDNNNNHPMYAGCAAIIHNGVIKNDDELFNTLKLERKSDTDSDILRAIIDKHGITKEAIKEIGKGIGSGAIAAVHPKFPDKLLLIRSGNPLTLASNEDFFFFASEKATLHKATRPFVQRMGIWFQAQKPDVDFSVMNDHTGWIIGPKGLESHTECKICQGNYIEPWRKTYEEYQQRQAKWDHRSKTTVAGEENSGALKSAWCFACKREWSIPVNGIPSAFQCNKKKGGCGQLLWSMPSDTVTGKKAN